MREKKIHNFMEKHSLPSGIQIHDTIFLVIYPLQKTYKCLLKICVIQLFCYHFYSKLKLAICETLVIRSSWNNVTLRFSHPGAPQRPKRSLEQLGEASSSDQFQNNFSISKPGYKWIGPVIPVETEPGCSPLFVLWIKWLKNACAISSSSI